MINGVLSYEGKVAFAVATALGLFILSAVAYFMFSQSAAIIVIALMVEAYELLIKNEQHYNKFGSKLARRWNQKIAKL